MYSIVDDKDQIGAFLMHYKKLQEAGAPESLKSGFRRISYSAKDDEGKIIGGIGGWAQFDISMIESLWVDRDYRNEGIATQLLENFKTKVLTADCKTILTTTTELSGSLGFWQKMGFEKYAKFEGKTAASKIHYLKTQIE